MTLFAFKSTTLFAFESMTLFSFESMKLFAFELVQFKYILFAQMCNKDKTQVTQSYEVFSYVQ